MKQVRCAIYTRKSSDEGLEQAFNSLDAQREACAAYILSQASEGWTALPEIYDDGGISGGTLDRPALQRLLAEVAAGRIDIIVVYKVDRLTRSLTDFSKLVEVFDRAGTSFVSVTQSFNTTTSMGRLTLNMLLSFAQFEREVTAERIRDKIAASKAKGMWMGGTPPLGYAPDGRSLKIVEEHAAIIRDIYARYLDLKNVRLVELALEDAGICTPLRTLTTTGRQIGGGKFHRGQLYHILKCPTYVGEIHHKGQIYQALFALVVDREMWDAVQALLSSNVKGERAKVRAASPSLLAGLLVDAVGEPLIATHANKGKVRYRYYVSKDLHQGDAPTGLRIPAREIEVAVAQRIAALFGDALGLAQTAWLSVPPSAMLAYHDRCAAIAIDLTKRDRATLRAIINSVAIHDGRIDIVCNAAAIANLVQAEQEPNATSTIVISSDVRLTRTGRAMRLIQSNGAAPGATQDRSLIRLLVKARDWWALLREGDIDITTLAERERVSAPWITRVLRLAFLSPTVVEAILAGNVRAGVDAAAMVATRAVSGDWSEQEREMLPGRDDRGCG